MINKTVLFLLFVAGGMTTGYGQTDYKKEGDACKESGDYHCARSNYQAYGAFGYNVDEELKIIDSCISILKVADSLQTNGLYGKAKEEYEKIQELNPGDKANRQRIEETDSRIMMLRSLHSKADSLYGMQLYPESLAEYNEILKLTPGDSEVRQRIEEIGLHFTDLIKVDPEQAPKPVTDSKVALGLNLLLPVTLNGEGNSINAGYGIGVKLLYLVKKPFRLAGEFDWCLLNDEVYRSFTQTEQDERHLYAYGYYPSIILTVHNRWNFSVYGHYLFYSGKSAFYPSVGLGMEGMTAEMQGRSESSPLANAAISLVNAAISLGGGAEFGLSDRLLLNVELLYRQNVSDKYGTIAFNGNRDVYDTGKSGIKLSAGLIFRF
jgi:tetratricopeptide (TPR) repeat protein